jgi:hypothetical protein
MRETQLPREGINVAIRELSNVQIVVMASRCPSRK